MFDFLVTVCSVYVCPTTVAMVPPPAEESSMSDPNPSSVSQDSAAPKTEFRDSNKETLPAQSGSQESGESPPVGKQEATGTESQSSVKFMSSAS